MSTAEVTPVEIARLAGVGRAAVSNWRRRYEDFPRPVGGTANSPRFALAEVEHWLRRQGKLAELPAEEVAWQQIRALASDHELPEAVRRAGELLLCDHPAEAADNQQAALRQALTSLASEHGLPDAFELLLRRMHDAARLPRVPDPVAGLMVALLGPDPATIYDPACGTGTLLLAALTRFPHADLRGEETNPTLLGLAKLRAAAHHATRTKFRSGGLRRAPDPPLEADAVLCAPPYADRDWAAGDMAYDPRWQYGVPPKAEPELAWVQHALANLRPGGHAVLLLPPAVAARASGRRIRAELLRRGALRAVIGLPAGAAPPHSLGLHLWLLRRPTPDDPADRVLIADLSAAGDAARDDPAEAAQAHTTALVETLSAVDRGDDPAGAPALRTQVVRIMDLLDDTVDLTPARRLRTEPEQVDATAVVRLCHRLGEDLHRLQGLLPAIGPAATRDSLPMITIGDLTRTGALTVAVHNAMRGEADTNQAGVGTVPVWHARDVIAGHGPAGRLPVGRLPDDAIRIAAGDVVAPVIGHQLVARVVTDAEADAMLGPNLYLLRPDPALLDPWFLSGFLRRDANTHRASSLGSIHRYDIRRAHVPRIPVEDQRRYGQLFQQLAEFDELLRTVTANGDDMMRLITDGLAAGALHPHPDAEPHE